MLNRKKFKAFPESQQSQRVANDTRKMQLIQELQTIRLAATVRTVWSQYTTRQTDDRQTERSEKAKMPHSGVSPNKIQEK